MEENGLKKSFVRLILAALFTVIIFSVPSFAEEHRTEVRTVRIRLEEDLPGNEPYAMNGEYRRDIATPILSGAHGFVYKKTSQVNSWLFPVITTRGVPELALRLEGVKNPTSVSINNILLTAGEYVEVPIDEAAELRVANASSRGLMRLMFTTLPIIRLAPAAEVYHDRNTPCTITVSDPDYQAHGLSEPVVTYEGVMSRRGRSSARFNEKHPYNFSLMQDGKKLDRSLLGLRTDSDWLVDSAYNDRSRMRNRVLMDVWDEIYRLPWNQALSGATKGVYVELFVNDVYKGLYALGEKQDRQQLGLSKTGGKWNSLFLRTGATGRDGASPAGFVSMGKERPEDDDPLLWYNVELRYPTENLGNVSELWNDFYEYVRLVVRGNEAEFAAGITRYADLDNLSRYWLFANAADLNDNMRKNMSFARLDDKDERFNRFILLPWDMDASLGRAYTSKRLRVDEVISNRLFDRLIRENPSNFRQILYDDWQELRAGPLSVNRIMEKFEHYYSIIRESGADLREMDKYPTFTSYVKAKYSYTLRFDKELEYIRNYLEQRLTWLDWEINSIRDGNYVKRFN